MTTTRPRNPGKTLSRILAGEPLPAVPVTIPLEVQLASERHARQAAHFTTRLEASREVTEAALNTLVDLCRGWFSDVAGFDRVNFDGDCMLVTTELSEAVEADRTDSMSDKIPEFHGRDEEIADALVRIFHMAGKYKINLSGAFIAKMRYNFGRPFKHNKAY